MTIWSLKDAKALTDQQRQIIDNYNKQFFDLDLAIYKDSLIIESILQRLVDSGIPFKFDQGGFENPIFGDIKAKKYFSEFDQYRSDINHWTVDAQMAKSNPHHFHIMDHNIHIEIANYYESAIIQNNLQS